MIQRAHGGKMDLNLQQEKPIELSKEVNIGLIKIPWSTKGCTLANISISLGFGLSVE